MSEFTAELRSAAGAITDRVGIDLHTPAPGMDTELWARLADAGFTTIAVPEQAGGGDASLADALAVVSATAQRGALTPLIEHGILAAWLAASAGHVLASATATVAEAGSSCTVRSGTDGPVLHGSVTDVAYATDADTVVVLLPSTRGTAGSTVVVASLADPGVVVSAGTDLTGVSLADVSFDSVPALFQGHSPVSPGDLSRRGALAYAAATAAAARAVHEQTLRHASERTQFGRPLAKFQAVQQRLAELAALTTMMEIAVDEAVELASAADDPAACSAVAAAKTVTAMSAHAVAAAGHQIHGAIGVTSEHRLGRFTTSLWSWRERHGSEHRWADELAGRALDDGVDVWDLVTGTTSADPGTAAAGTDRSRP